MGVGYILKKEDQCRLTVEPAMRDAIKLYANNRDITIAAATFRLLYIGLRIESMKGLRPKPETRTYRVKAENVRPLMVSREMRNLVKRYAHMRGYTLTEATYWLLRHGFADEMMYNPAAEVMKRKEPVATEAERIRLLEFGKELAQQKEAEKNTVKSTLNESKEVWSP